MKFLLYNNTIVALHVSSNPICAAKITRSLPLTRSFGAAQIGLLSTCKATISYYETSSPYLNFIVSWCCDFTDI